MNNETITTLNALNQAFYATTAVAFNETRETAWEGWHELVAYLPATRPLRVLDVGCGNGRFARFLAAQGVDYYYHGVDNSPALLDYARARLGADRHTLEEWDVITRPLALPPEYDLVVAFGVFHHIPSTTGRLDFARRLADACGRGGVLAFTTWRFYEFEALRARVVAWETLENAEKLTLEAGDYLLDWRRGEQALRYCHYVDDVEQDMLCMVTGMSERTRYRADGAENRANCYSVLEAS